MPRAAKRVTRVDCPTCGRPVPWVPEERHRPFCSERCRLIDLGEWIDGGRAIPGDENGPGGSGGPPTE